MAFFKPKKTRLWLLLILPSALLLFQLLFLKQEENPLFKTVAFFSGAAQSGFHAVGSSVSEAARKYVFLLKVREENRGLKKTNAAQEAEQTLMEELEAENARLRSLIHFSLRRDMKLLPAEVVAYDFFSRLITLNRGAVHGVQKRMGVIHPKGAVGHVFRVASHSSQALLLTSKLSSLPGRALRSRLRGLIEPGGVGGGGVGGGRNLLMFKYFDFQEDFEEPFAKNSSASGASGEERDQAGGSASAAEAASRRRRAQKQASGGKIAKGDVIVTDASRNFPSGLPAGVASFVQKTADGGFRVFVKPSAPLSSLEEALIILDF